MSSEGTVAAGVQIPFLTLPQRVLHSKTLFDLSFARVRRLHMVNDNKEMVTSLHDDTDRNAHAAGMFQYERKLLVGISRIC